MERAEPDSFVVLFPVPWEELEAGRLEGVHAEQWGERAEWSVSAVESAEVDGIRGRGGIDGPDEKSADLVVEEPIEELVEVAGTSKEPYQPSELALLEGHGAIWRVVVDGGRERGLENAVWTSQLMASFVEAGAAGAFVPALVEMHSPGMIRSQTASIGHIQPVVNLFVSARDDEDWMTTRGLTAFELPELETVVDSGLNDAFFRLMDVASEMIDRREPFPVGADLEVGPESFEIEQGRQGPEDEQVPFSGYYGVLTLRPE